MGADVDAVVFDMDGVIVDSEVYWHEAEGSILAEAVPGAEVDVEEITGMNVLDQYDHLAEEYDMAVSRDAYFDLYDRRAERVYTEKASLMDGFHDLLDALRDRGIAIALVSSSFPHWIDMVLDRFDLRDAFDVVVSAEDIEGPSKPDPHIYEHAADALGIPPERCVAVEDSHHGVVAATRAGMRCIGFRARHNQDTDLTDADAVVNGPGELRERLLAAL